MITAVTLVLFSLAAGRRLPLLLWCTFPGATRGRALLPIYRAGSCH